MGDSFPWEDLLDSIEDGKVVPVIGHELVQADYQGRRVSLQRVIAEKLADRLGDRETLTRGWTPNFELNDVVSTYLSQPGTKLVGVYERVGTILRQLQPPFPIPPALSRLAAIQPFDLYVTLTFDSLLARAIDQVRFKGNPVTREIEFSINQSTAAQTEALKVRAGDAPIVFSLFGRAASKSDFAIHDEDALEFIHRLVSGDVTPPEWLLSDLRSRHLLIVGVHMPEWLGRFVLRAATRDRLGMAQRAYYVAAENAPSDAALAQFLSRFGRETRMSVYNGGADAFVAELHKRWLERRGEEAPRADAGGLEHAERGSIFLSYGRENLAEVERLYDEIKKIGGDVWFDKAELAAGDYWERKILPQIQRHVQLFVPVISLRTAGRTEAYVFREWNEAVERSRQIIGRRFILPTVVDADYTGNLQPYQALLDSFPSFRTANICGAPGGVPDKVLRDTLVDELRSLRS